MANTTYKFYRGLLANLPEEKKNGAVYFTTDEHAIYADISDNERIRLGDYQQVATRTDLPSSAEALTSAIYYIVDENILCRWDKEAGLYKQINVDTGATKFQKQGDGQFIVDITYDTESRIATLIMGDVESLAATKVNTTSEITVTTTVGNYAKGKVIPKDTDLQTLILDMLCKDINPVTTAPSITVTLTNSGAKEVGTKITPSYSTSFSVGKYVANGEEQPTNVTLKTIKVTDSNNATRFTTGGNFDEIQVTESTNYYLTAEVEYSAGDIPKTYLGNEYPAGQIAASTIRSNNSSAITGYRAWFYGDKTGDNLLDVNNLTSDNIRNLTAKNGSIPSSITTNKMQQMFFAIPAGKKNSIAVANAISGAPQSITKLTGIKVAGANGYTPVDYDVWYVNNAAPETGTTKFNITVS